MAGGAPAPDPEVAALREEVARLRSERTRVKGLKAQLERSHAHLGEQRAAFLKQQACPGPGPHLCGCPRLLIWMHPAVVGPPF